MTAVDANTIADQLDGCRCTDLADALYDAGETIAELRTRLAAAELERDVAQMEAAGLAEQRDLALEAITRIAAAWAAS